MHAFCNDVLCYFVLEKDRDRGEMGGGPKVGGGGGARKRREGERG